MHRCQLLAMGYEAWRTTSLPCRTIVAPLYRPQVVNVTRAAGDCRALKPQLIYPIESIWGGGKSKHIVPSGLGAVGQ